MDRRNFMVATLAGLSWSAQRAQFGIGPAAPALPLGRAPIPGVAVKLDPRDDGAALDGLTDDTRALAKLVSRIGAAGSNPVIVDLNGQTMRVGTVPHTNTAIFVGAGSNVTIRNGRLLVKGTSVSDYPFAAVYGSRFESFTLENFEVDYEHPPFFQAKCIATSGADILLDWEGYWPPSFNNVQAIYERDKVSYDPLAVVTFGPSGSTAFDIEMRSGTTLWVRALTDVVTSPAVGNLYTLSHRNFDANAIVLEGGSNLTMIGVNIRTAAGAGVFARYVDRIRITNHNQSPAFGSRRWQTTNVDALHFDMCSGHIDISDSTFGFCGDDALNIVSRQYQAVNVSGRTFSLISPGSRSQTIESGLIITDAGDQVAFTDVNGIPRGIAIVRAQVGAGTPARVIAVDSLPNGLESGWRINLLRYAPKVRISNNRIGHNRGRGIVGVARNVEIRDNNISGTFGAGIEVGVSPYQTSFFEGQLQAKKIVIINNTVERCAADKGFSPAAIIVAAYKLDGTYASFGAGVDVNVSSNTITDCANSAILVAGFAGVSIKGNSMANVAKNPYKTKEGTTSSAIAIMNCEKVQIAGNMSISGSSTIDIFGIMGTNVVWKVNPGMHLHQFDDRLRDLSGQMR